MALCTWVPPLSDHTVVGPVGVTASEERRSGGRLRA
jgi:hypothetical protein